jgi:hypothetical protein
MNIKLSSNALFPVLARALEYDGIWTLESYAGATNKVIFADLTMPDILYMIG